MMKWDVLVVDDDPDLSALVVKTLEPAGYFTWTVDSGSEALAFLQDRTVDAILLDMQMPHMDGLETCRRIKSDLRLRSIPVIFVTGLRDPDTLVRAFDAGANDYVGKPYDERELLVRLNTHVTLARLSQENERLLLTILPPPIAARLVRGERTIADRLDDVSVLFADLVGFTELSAVLPPVHVVSLLNELFSGFDRLVERHGLEKIKTIGDSYMVAGGLQQPDPDHLDRMARLALEMCSAPVLLPDWGAQPRIRIGLNVGPVVAGVIGVTKPAYDLWGDAVNVGSRLESHGVPGRVHVGDAVESRLSARFNFESRGHMDIKGKGSMRTHLLVSAKPRISPTW